MVENVNQEENSPEVVLEGGDSNPESLVVRKEEELAKANARLQELEQVVDGKESEMAALKQAGEEMEARLATLSLSLSEAVAGYRGMVVAVWIRRGLKFV